LKEYEGLYDPIVGASDYARPAVPTPEDQLTRTFRLREVYSDLKDELVDEVASIESRIIKPASDARDYILPIRKTIKKRENKRVDYEQCEDKVKKLQRKAGKSAKEESALAKAEDEMARRSEVCRNAGHIFGYCFIANSFITACSSLS
jgi:amphiphysin